MWCWWIVIIKRKNSPVGIVLNLFDKPDNNMATIHCVAELAHDESNKQLDSCQIVDETEIIHNNI